MFKKYLLSSVYCVPENEDGAEKKPEKTAVELEREKIEVLFNKKDDEGEPIVEDKEEKEPEKEELETTKEEEIEKNEKTAEELEQDKIEAKSQKEKDKVQKRIDRLTAKNKELEAELVATKKKLEADPEKAKVLTEDDVEALAEKKAEAKQLEREFANACNKLADEATKLDKKFPDKVTSMGKEIGPIPSVMIGILEDLENGGAVLNHLTDNVEDADDIYKMSPAKMGMKLKEISIELKNVKKPVKEISKAPDPINALGGNAARSAAIPDPKKDMDAWVKWRNKNIADARAGGRTQLR